MSAARPPVLVDTSVAVALLLDDHDAHGRALAALRTRRRGLAGHAQFEAYSVLTRLPPPQRRPPAAVQALLARNFPESRLLGPAVGSALLAELVALGITGGNVYDALVAATAREHDLLLLTLDTRAAETYGRLGARYELI